MNLYFTLTSAYVTFLFLFFFESCGNMGRFPKGTKREPEQHQYWLRVGGNKIRDGAGRKATNGQRETTVLSCLAQCEESKILVLWLSLFGYFSISILIVDSVFL